MGLIVHPTELILTGALCGKHMQALSSWKCNDYDPDATPYRASGAGDALLHRRARGSLFTEALDNHWHPICSGTYCLM